jgi:hypothetical protein
MVVEKFREQYERKQVAEVKDTPSLSDVLKDKNRSELLTSSLQKTEDGQKIAEKIIKGEIDFSKDQLKILQAAQEQVELAVSRSKDMMSYLNPDRIKLIAQSQPEFGKIVNMLGAENAERFLNQYLAKLIIDDPKKAESMQNNLEAIKGKEDALKKIDTRAEELRKKYGLSKAEFENALIEAVNSKNPRASIEKFVKERLYSQTLLGRIGSWLGGRFKVEEIMSQVNPEEMKEQIDEINKQLGELAEVIGVSTIESDDLRKVLIESVYQQSEIRKENKEDTVFMSFKESAAKLDNKDEINRSFNEYKSSIERGWDSLDDGQKKKFTEEFVKNYLNSKKIKSSSSLYKIFTKIINNLII